MALRFDPPDLVRQAAEEEGWTDDDRAFVARIVSTVFVNEFSAELIEGTSVGVNVHRTNLVNFADVRALDVQGLPGPAARGNRPARQGRAARQHRAAPRRSRPSRRLVEQVEVETLAARSNPAYNIAGA